MLRAVILIRVMLQWHTYWTVTSVITTDAVCCAQLPQCASSKSRFLIRLWKATHVAKIMISTLFKLQPPKLAEQLMCNRFQAFQRFITAEPHVTQHFFRPIHQMAPQRWVCWVNSFKHQDGRDYANKQIWIRREMIRTTTSKERVKSLLDCVILAGSSLRLLFTKTHLLPTHTGLVYTLHRQQTSLLDP